MSIWTANIIAYIQLFAGAADVTKKQIEGQMSNCCLTLDAASIAMVKYNIERSLSVVLS